MDKTTNIQCKTNVTGIRMLKYNIFNWEDGNFIFYIRSLEIMVIVRTLQLYLVKESAQYFIIMS
jgi:uncharacterized protein YegP (UPF0339 family)